MYRKYGSLLTFFWFSAFVALFSSSGLTTGRALMPLLSIKVITVKESIPKKEIIKNLSRVKNSKVSKAGTDK
jgi:hypothetical protein